jgi:uncharacterized membrane protein YgcG
VYTNSSYCIAFKRDHCHHHQHHEGSVHWARVNGRVGIVRTVETGAKGKPAVNWKAGVDLPPQKPGEVMRHAELSLTSKVRLLNAAPKEYRAGGVENLPRVPVPAITAEFRDRDAAVQTAAGRGTNGVLHQASYDYKARGFTMPGEAHPAVVARMNSYGSVSAPTGHNGSPGAVPGLVPAAHGAGGFGGSTGGGGGHSGSGSASGGGSSHAGGGSSSASNAASSAASAAAGSHH